MSDESTRARTTEAAEIAAEALRHLAWLADAGVAEVPEPAVSHDHGVRAPPGPVRGGPSRDARETSGRAPPSPPPSAPTATSTPARAPTAAPTSSAAATPRAGAYRLGDRGCGSPALLAVREELGECARCKLAPARTNLVFGVGDPRAELMFVGEGPGADEDLQGEPFVGRAGQLLTRMIEAMGYRREDVYIANVVKCRPPGNRNPEPDEMDACEPFLRAQIRAVAPRAIVALGKIAAQTLLRDTTPISRLRGRWATYEGTRLMPTFHPAYLLRSPEEKKKAWEDLQLVMRELGKAPPSR
ncbi:MAG TPA: uracil-DNA glycosylase [Anaeromyxobacter sp.]|nr:uracil-DNA glycosylase [Anaeromyxobacter sp.]